ncbi:MAG: hypothetical protein ACOC38_05175 [Promethearchaeia archaeon]
MGLNLEFSWQDLGRVLAFVSISAAVLVPVSFFVYGGIQVYIWIIPLAAVPVRALQCAIVAISGLFALSSSWILLTVANNSNNRIGTGSISVAGHLLRLSVFLMGIIGSSLYFWNILAFLCGFLLLWFGRNKAWEIMGVVSIAWTLLVQIFVYVSFWR